MATLTPPKIPGRNEPWVDPRTGSISRVWLDFLRRSAEYFIKVDSLAAGMDAQEIPIVFLPQGEEGEGDYIMIPGPTGPSGQDGRAGMPGMDGDQGEEQFFLIPAPPAAGVFGHIGIDAEAQILSNSVTTVTGTVTSGTVATTRTINQTYYEVAEAAGAPGFDVQFTFTGLPGQPAKFKFAGRYVGSAAHEVEVQIYNYSTLAWDDINATTKDIPHSTTDYTVIFNYPTDATNYLSGGESKVRLYHTSVGSATHDLYVDYVHVMPKTLNMPTAGTAYQLTGMTAGASNNMTVDTSSITIIQGGKYLFTGNISFGGKDSSTINGELYKNGVMAGVTFKRRLGTSGDVGSAGGNQIISLARNDVLTFYFESDTDSSFLSIDSLGVSLVKVGD